MLRGCACLWAWRLRGAIGLGFFLLAGWFLQQAFQAWKEQTSCRTAGRVKLPLLSSCFPGQSLADGSEVYRKHLGQLQDAIVNKLLDAFQQREALNAAWAGTGRSCEEVENKWMLRISQRDSRVWFSILKLNYGMSGSMADLYWGKINAASSYLSHISALWAVTTELRLVHPHSFDHWASSYNSTLNFDSCNSFPLYLPMLLESL